MTDKHNPETNESESTNNEEFLISEEEMTELSEADLEKEAEKAEEAEEQAGPDAESRIKELNDKYLRCYAEFDNYRKRVNKEKEELVKYGNESLIYELLPAIDSLELALKHASGDADSGVVKGVEMTLKELFRALEKFSLSRIEAAGRKFDPSVHHAMITVEKEDTDENMVVEEMRPGYLLHNKVLRPTMVSVSTKPKKAESREEPVSDTEDTEITINKDIEEE
jgi:molecular chaperone GrpE